MAIQIEKWRGEGGIQLPALLGGGFMSFGERLPVRGTEAQVLACFGGTLPGDLRLFTVADALADRHISGTAQMGHVNARTRTTGALPAYTRTANRIQANANGALAAQDGITLVAGEVLLLLNGAVAADNGPYRVLQVGTAALPFIFERVHEFDSAVEAQLGFACRVMDGVTSHNKLFALTAAVATINADPVTFTEELPEQTAYTQTFGLADKTHAAITVGADIAAFADPPTAPQMAALRTFVNALKADHDDLARLVNSLINDLRTLNLVG